MNAVVVNFIFWLVKQH